MSTNRVEELRLELGISKAELARRASLNATTVGEITLGVTRGRPSQIARLAVALGVDPAELMPEQIGG